MLNTRHVRWPLVFRFIKGAIHAAILLPVFLHAAFTAFVVYLDVYVFDTVGLPSSIVGLAHMACRCASQSDYATVDPILIYSRGFDARFPQPDLLQPILGWAEWNEHDLYVHSKFSQDYRHQWLQHRGSSHCHRERGHREDDTYPHVNSLCSQESSSR